MTTPEPREDHELAACPLCGDPMQRLAQYFGHTSAGQDSDCPLRHNAWPVELIGRWNRRPSPVAESTPSIRDAVADGEGVAGHVAVSQAAREAAEGVADAISRMIEDNLRMGMATTRVEFDPDSGLLVQAFARFEAALRTANTGRAEVLEACAKLVEEWNGATADGNTFHIAAAIRTRASTEGEG